MIRIFTTLAMFSLVMMIAALVLGLYLGDIHGVHDPNTLRSAMVHRLLGMGAALAVVLVDSIVITYFIGTSRWCKEVVETYQLDEGLISRSVGLKRKSFPWSLLSIFCCNWSRSTRRRCRPNDWPCWVGKLGVYPFGRSTGGSVLYCLSVLSAGTKRCGSPHP